MTTYQTMGTVSYVSADGSLGITARSGERIFVDARRVLAALQFTKGEQVVVVSVEGDAVDLVSLAAWYHSDLESVLPTEEIAA